MLRTNRQGFTLIELMVVIVIIGVLASLAIPRFTDASNKAKVAEAPRVLASFESAYLAGVAEGNTASTNIVFDPAAITSKWFAYTMITSATPTTGDVCTGTTSAQIGRIAAGATLTTTYDAGTDAFTHAGSTADLTKYVPNFLP